MKCIMLVQSQFDTDVFPHRKVYPPLRETFPDAFDSPYSGYEGALHGPRAERTILYSMKVVLVFL